MKVQKVRKNVPLTNNIRYANDPDIATSLEDLQHLLQRASEVSEGYGLKLNNSKIKWMLINKNRTPIGNHTLNQTPIEHEDRNLKELFKIYVL